MLILKRVTERNGIKIFIQWLFRKSEVNMVSEEEMRSCIQEWMAQALCIEDLAKIDAAIISETDKQLVYMSEQIKGEIVRNNK